MNSFLQAFKEFSDSIKTVVLKDRKGFHDLEQTL